MTIKLLASFLLMISAYLGWWSVSTSAFLWLLPATILPIAAIGLFLNKHWSQYLWHVIAIVVSLSWIVSIVRLTFSGWPYENTISSVISLIPGLFLVVICAGGSSVVSKYFSKRSLDETK